MVKKDYSNQIGGSDAGVYRYITCCIVYMQWNHLKKAYHVEYAIKLPLILLRVHTTLWIFNK